MKKKYIKREGVSTPSEALSNMRSLPSDLMDVLSMPLVWGLFVAFMVLPLVYYFLTAIIFSVIPKAIWSIFY
jgi:hypothetical protein